MSLKNPELNFFKVLYLVNIGIVILLLVLLRFFDPHSVLAITYFDLMLAGLFLIIADIVIFGTPIFEIFNTISADEDPAPAGQKVFWLQNAFPQNPLFYCLLVSVLFGVLLGSFYVYSYTVQGTAYIAVPRMFSTTPVIFTAQAFDVLQVGYAVSVVEETLWTGFMFPTLWGIFAFALMTRTKNRMAAFAIAFVIAVLLNGWLASWVFHQFVYGGNLYAYANGQFHFTLTSFMAGMTGTTVGGIIAHAMHNAAIVMSRHTQTFAALPIQAVR